MKSKSRKLRDHARSERAIGNVAAAQAYDRKAAELEANEKAARKSQKISAAYRCSCGFSIQLEIDAGAKGALLAEMMLAPHRAGGHILTPLSP